MPLFGLVSIMYTFQHQVPHLDNGMWSAEQITSHHLQAVYSVLVGILQSQANKSDRSPVIFLSRLQCSIPRLDERIKEEQLDTTDRVATICVTVSFMDWKSNRQTQTKVMRIRDFFFFFFGFQIQPLNQYSLRVQIWTVSCQARMSECRWSLRCHEALNWLKMLKRTCWLMCFGKKRMYTNIIIFRALSI